MIRAEFWPMSPAMSCVWLQRSPHGVVEVLGVDVRVSPPHLFSMLSLRGLAMTSPWHKGTLEEMAQLSPFCATDPCS